MKLIFHISDMGKVEMSTEGSDVCNYKDGDPFWTRVELKQVEEFLPLVYTYTPLNLEVKIETT